MVTNSDLGIIEDGALIYENERVIWVGHRKDAGSADSMIDAGNNAVIN